MQPFSSKGLRAMIGVESRPQSMTTERGTLRGFLGSVGNGQRRVEVDFWGKNVEARVTTSGTLFVFSRGKESSL